MQRMVFIFADAQCTIDYWNFSSLACAATKKTGTYKVMPMHCKVPTISEQDKTVIAATELIEALRETAPSVATDKSWHATTIADLTAIITDSPS